MLSTLEKVHSEYRKLIYIFLVTFILLLSIAGIFTYGQIKVTIDDAVKTHVKDVIPPEKITAYQNMIIKSDEISKRFIEIQSLDYKKSNVQIFMEKISLIDNKLPIIVRTDTDKLLIKESSASLISALPAIQKFLTINNNIKETEHIYQSFWVIVKYYYGGNETVKDEIKKFLNSNIDKIELLYNHDSLEKEVPASSQKYIKAIDELKKIM